MISITLTDRPDQQLPTNLKIETEGDGGNLRIVGAMEYPDFFDGPDWVSVFDFRGPRRAHLIEQLAALECNIGRVSAAVERIDFARSGR
jgi:hypothetical protein